MNTESCQPEGKQLLEGDNLMFTSYEGNNCNIILQKNAIFKTCKYI